MKIEPDDFKLECKSIWSFPIRGSWATHNPNWRGNWSPYIPRNLILRYTNINDLLLDQFVGGGTTLVESILLGRNIIGVDINKKALIESSEVVNFKYKNNVNVKLIQGDATNLFFIKSNTIDFICTHPPYADIIRYSEDLDNDLSRMSIGMFLANMKKVADESYRVLKRGKFCSILIGDKREYGFIQPLGFQVMNIFIDSGFKLKEIIIKEQHNCKMTSYWKEKSQKYNFLLIAHEYIFVFQKDK